MEQKELNTFQNFIQSNKDFYSAINDNLLVNQPIDEFLKVELLILYFTINKYLMKKIDTIFSWKILDLIESQDYYVENGGIYYHNQFFTIDYLIAFARYVEQIREKETINYQNDDTIIYHPKNDKVIPFPVYNSNNLTFTNKERCQIFDLTNRIDQFTKPYIEETNTKFINTINEIIINLVSEENDNLPQIYLIVLYAFISLYPYLTYAQDKLDFPFETLNLPQNEIGLMKSSDSNPEIKKIATKIKEIDSLREKLSCRKRYIELYDPDNKYLQNQIKKSLLNLEKEKKDQVFHYCIKKLSADVYNKDLLVYILKSFVQGNIDVNETHRDPIIKMFYIEEGEVEFHSAMHISSLLKIVKCIAFEIVPAATKSKAPKK